jgi:hypothetical protein
MMWFSVEIRTEAEETVQQKELNPYPANVENRVSS